MQGHTTSHGLNWWDLSPSSLASETNYCFYAFLVLNQVNRLPAQKIKYIKPRVEKLIFYCDYLMCRKKKLTHLKG